MRFAAVLALAAAVWVRPALAQETLEIVASKAGWKPKLVKLRRGETARITLKTSDDEHCFALDAFRVEKRIGKGRTTTFELFPDKAGEFPFYCCLEPDNAAQKGKLVVAE